MRNSEQFVLPSFNRPASRVAIRRASQYEADLSGLITETLREFKLPIQGKTVLLKPNFVEPDPGPGDGDGGYFLYAGRLTEEKGIRVLIDCWTKAPDLPPLLIAGDGPLREEVKNAAAIAPNIYCLGMKSGEEVLDLMKHAKAILCPSLWYEGMPRVVIESLAAGTPVIASDIGGYPEMIVDGESGALFATGDAGALLGRIRELDERAAWQKMRSGARLRFLAEYTGDRNFSALLGIYRTAMYPGSNTFPIPASPGTAIP